MPVIPIRAWNSAALFTASWPVSASATYSTSAGVRELALKGELGHQLVVDVQPARAVHDQGVVPDGARLGERLLQQLAGRGELGVEDRHLGLSADRAQLLAGGGPLHVGRHQQRVAPAALEPAAELGGRGGLARALQAGHQDHARQPRAEHQRARLGAAQHLDHLVAHDAQHGLIGRQALQDVLAHRTGAHALDELLRDAEVDVGLEQGEPDLAKRRVDLGLAEDTLAAEGPEYPLEPFAERLEHGRPTPGRAAPKPKQNLIL